MPEVLLKFLYCEGGMHLKFVGEQDYVMNLSLAQIISNKKALK
jgi:hypothetical protein